MVKYLFTDLDETLLVNHHVPDINKEAIENAKGLKTVVCTGRSFDMVQETLKELNIQNQANQYSICCNGAVVMENNGNVIYCKGVDTECVKAFLEFSKTVEAVCFVFSNEKIFILNPSEFEVQRKKEQGADFVVVEEIEEDVLHSIHVTKLMLAQKDPIALSSIMQQIPDLLKENCQITISSSRYLEFNAKGIHKGLGMVKLMEYLQDSLENCMSVGDNYNDLEMIQMAGIGCAVQNAEEDVKKVADYVCLHDYQNGAVKEIIDKFV